MIAGGIVEASALARAAKRFPQARFALLDGDRREALHPSPNIEGSVFHTEEASYLAGFLSARMADRRPQPHIVSIVAGSPPGKWTRSSPASGPERTVPTPG